jgi:hypothetical protein
MSSKANKEHRKCAMHKIFVGSIKKEVPQIYQKKILKLLKYGPQNGLIRILQIANSSPLKTSLS